MKINTALAIANRKINEARRLYNILESTRFENAYNCVISSENKTEALQKMAELVEAGRCDGLVLWIKEHQVLDISELNVSQLRILASSYGVYKYYSKSKIELVQEVRFALEHSKSNDNSNTEKEN